MTIGRIAALPMYDFADVADSHDQLWSAVADQLASAGITDVPRTLTRDLDHVDTWRHPGLLLGQACGCPLAKFYAKHVRVVATPCYRVPGCEGFRYRSAIVVRGTSRGIAGVPCGSGAAWWTSSIRIVE